MGLVITGPSGSGSVAGKTQYWIVFYELYFFGPEIKTKEGILTHTPHWPLPAVRDLTRDGRWSTYD